MVFRTRVLPRVEDKFTFSKTNHCAVFNMSYSWERKAKHFFRFWTSKFQLWIVKNVKSLEDLGSGGSLKLISCSSLGKPLNFTPLRMDKLLQLKISFQLNVSSKLPLSVD